MGTTLICNGSTTDRKPDLFAQAESVAFQHVNSALRDMPFCDRGDLCQAAKGYFFESVRASGAAHLFREEYVERKAERLGAWWHTKHTASNTKRPHTKYTPAQALRGRQVAAMRKRNRNNWLALQVQLFRQGGGKVAEVAEQFGCSTRNIFKLSRRKFPRIVLVVLCRVLNVNVPKNSGGFCTSKISGYRHKRDLTDAPALVGALLDPEPTPAGGEPETASERIGHLPSPAPGEDQPQGARSVDGIAMPTRARAALKDQGVKVRPAPEQETPAAIPPQLVEQLRAAIQAGAILDAMDALRAQGHTAAAIAGRLCRGPSHAPKPAPNAPNAAPPQTRLKPDAERIPSNPNARPRYPAPPAGRAIAGRGGDRQPHQRTERDHPRRPTDKPEGIDRRRRAWS